MWDLISMIIHSSQPGLEWLKLSECGVGKKSCLRIAKDCKLELLYLDKNDLDNECCSILTTSLQNNTVLEKLNFDDND